MNQKSVSDLWQMQKIEKSLVLSEFLKNCLVTNAYNFINEFRKLGEKRKKYWWQCEKLDISTNLIGMLVLYTNNIQSNEDSLILLGIREEKSIETKLA